MNLLPRSLPNNIQSIIFNKKYYYPNDTKEVLNNLKIKPIKDIHETKNYYRYRINNPNKDKKYRTYDTGYGIKIVYYI